MNEKFQDLSKEEQRSRMKERGVKPPRPWMERPFYLGSVSVWQPSTKTRDLISTSFQTSNVFEPYVPPEGDGKLSAFSKTGAKQKVEFLEKKSKSIMAIRKIRQFEEDFDAKEFAVIAQDIYEKAHECLVTKDKLKLRTLATERAYPEMMHNIRYCTVRWKLLSSLEPPRVVHARQTTFITNDNYFAQLTVRFHTQQTLTVYDRFGRLMHGSEIVAKDVLEYVVFEKHISNEYGVWRLHDKIIPDWVPAVEPALLTHRIIEEPEEPVEPSADTKALESGIAEQQQSGSPPVATA